MKINWKNVVAVLVVIGGGVGVSIAAIRSNAQPKISNVGVTSDSSMVSMTGEMGGCDMCSDECRSHCNGGACTLGESMQDMANENGMAMGGTMTPMMGDEKMSDAKMENTMSHPSEENAMAPNSGSEKMVDGAKMADAPKM